MFDGNPTPPCPDCPRPGPMEAFISLFLVFWLFFLLALCLLPPTWSDAIWEIVFPFAPRRKK